MPGDVGSVIGREERDSTSDVFGTPNAAERNLFDRSLLEFFAENFGHGSCDKAGSDRVTSNVAGADFTGDGHGEANEPCFGSGIVRLSGLAHLSEDAGDVDDASPALFKHGGDDLLNAEEGGGEISLEHGVPIGTFHPHHKLIASNSGVVNENVNFAELGDGGFNGRFDLLFIGDIDGEGNGFASGGGDFGDQFIELVLITRGDSNGRAFFGKAQGAGTADALRG